MKLKLSKQTKVKEWVKVLDDVVELGITAPTHRSILAVKAVEGTFLKALSEYREEWITYKKDYDTITALYKGKEVPADEERRFIDRFNALSFKDLETLEPIYDFISEYTLGVKGIEVEEGNIIRDVDTWDELTPEYQREVLENLSIIDINDVYTRILSLTALSPNA